MTTGQANDMTMGLNIATRRVRILLFLEMSRKMTLRSRTSVSKSKSDLAFPVWPRYLRTLLAKWSTLGRQPSSHRYKPCVPSVDYFIMFS